MSRHRMRSLWAAVFSGGALVASPAAWGQCVATETAKITASDARPNDRFGEFVSISGAVALVAARLADDACPEDIGCDSGSAYVFRFDGEDWAQEQKLTASDTSDRDKFGRGSISGDIAVVGAPHDDDACPEDMFCESGSAYVYRFNGTTWVQEQKLTASDDEANDRFGCCVSVDGNVAVIGALNDDDGAPYAGAAYVFRFDGANWIEEAKLLAPDAAPGDSFGISVSLDDNVAVIGALRNDAAGINSGSGYVFRFDGANWNSEAKLTASDAGEGDHFGEFVSIRGDAVLIGARNDDDAGSNSGSAYVFRFNGIDWVEEAKLTASDAASGDWFGHSVSISGNTALVGAYSDDDGGTSSGSAYVYWFDGTTWVESGKLVALGAASRDEFGHSVAVGGDVAVIGAWGDDDAGSESGALYFFEGTSLECNDNGTLDLCEPDCNDNRIPDDCDIAGGASEDCTSNGIPDECEPDSDGDGVIDDCDVCPGGDDNVDTDGDGVPDGCDTCPGGDENSDGDGDGLCDAVDNCPTHANVDQADHDADGFGDACDGACCYGVAGWCLDGGPIDHILPEDCHGEYYPGEDCGQGGVDCETISVPAVSRWGIVLACLLLILGMVIKFGWRRRAERSPQ